MVEDCVTKKTDPAKGLITPSAGFGAWPSSGRRASDHIRVSGKMAVGGEPGASAITLLACWTSVSILNYHLASNCKNMRQRNLR